MLTELGNFLIIETKDIRSIGRLSRGIIGIKLSADDHVIKAHTIEQNINNIISISGNGLIKQTSMNEFNVQSKNTKGTKIQKLQKADWMADFIATNEEEILITATSSCLKIKTIDIPILTKDAQGVKSIKMQPKDNIIKISRL